MSHHVLAFLAGAAAGLLAGAFIRERPTAPAQPAPTDEAHPAIHVVRPAACDSTTTTAHDDMEAIAARVLAAAQRDLHAANYTG